ncbi:ac59-like protein [Clanis bilineata nucleopolyhedrovirus]|uniref:Ac59-like protein n=1 Tax=Clanis bilineata nucleopolyhedrovirus TaxID=1307957 RepID=Q0N456_9ABAC|nr:ac59-like protein [Clanis bilineata nucleopolyhedrovirus]ABF47387.1 ac59-like protein [Clanis bilineata nucleopolyhedrovirus]
MFHLNDSLYKQELPARARKLFVSTFKKYHKLDGGDEDLALHIAQKAVERDYVKFNNRWIPKRAAEEIMRHDIDDDTDDDDSDYKRLERNSPRSFEASTLSRRTEKGLFGKNTTRSYGANKNQLHAKLFNRESESDTNDDDDDYNSDHEDTHDNEDNYYYSKNKAASNTAKKRGRAPFKYNSQPKKRFTQTYTK